MMISKYNQTQYEQILTEDIVLKRKKKAADKEKARKSEYQDREKIRKQVWMDKNKKRKFPQHMPFHFNKTL